MAGGPAAFMSGVVADKATATVDDNDIADNRMWGVTVRANSHCTLRRNRINGNRRSAVDVRDGARATIEGNDLTGNAGGPWSITGDCEPNVRRVRNQEHD